MNVVTRVIAQPIREAHSNHLSYMRIFIEWDTDRRVNMFTNVTQCYKELSQKNMSIITTLLKIWRRIFYFSFTHSVTDSNEIKYESLRLCEMWNTRNWTPWLVTLIFKYILKYLIKIRTILYVCYVNIIWKMHIYYDGKTNFNNIDQQKATLYN